MLMTAECLGSEASAGYMMQDPGALALAEGALATCRSLKPVPRLTESRLLGILGGVHIANHRWEAAIKAYEQSIAAGDVIQDLRRLSILYSGMSMAYQAGEVAASRSHFERALGLFEESHAGDVDMGPHLLSLCELELAESHLEEAERFATRALEAARQISAVSTLADAHGWLGQIAALRGDDSRADAEFAAAFDALLQPGAAPPELLSRTYARYADVLEARGDVVGAVQQLKRALASRSNHMAVESSYATA